MVLFINACVRGESRTRRLASCVLKQYDHYEEVNLNTAGLQSLNEDSLTKRTDFIAAGDFDHPMFDYAKQFAAADEIVIAAPYWDNSFPALLKIYLENIYVTHIVSEYGADGRPVGLCRAKKLYYVTTAGGPYNPAYSYDYLSQMAVECFGIPETCLIKAEMLDVDGFDPEEILRKAEAEICNMLSSRS